MQDLVFILFCAALCTQYAGAVQSFSAPMGPLCPGTQVTINCTVVDEGQPFLRGTYWALQKGGNATEDYCYLSHSNPLDVDDTRCEPFIAELKEQNGHFFPSVLSAQVGLELNNMTVECIGPTLSDTVGSATLQVVGTGDPPTLVLQVKEDDILQLPGEGSYNVTLQWSLPHEYMMMENLPISRYLLTVSPQAVPCGSNCTVLAGSRKFAERRFSLLLSVDQNYHITIRAENCGNFQSGNENQEINIQLQAPGPPDYCKSIPYYDQDTKVLVAIESTWSSMSTTHEIAPGIPVSAKQYILMYSTNANFRQSEIVNVSEVCSEGICKHVTVLRGNLSLYSGSFSADYSVKIAARNVIGNGQPMNCTITPLGSRNDVVGVKPIVGTTHVLIDISNTIHFPFNISVSYGTEASYSHFPYIDNLTADSISQQENRTSKSTTIQLSQDLIPKTTYHYKAVVYIVNTSMTIVVLGSFKIDCDPTDLGMLSDSHDPRCRDSDGVAVVANGIVCYEGRSANSSAWYSCNPGYTHDTTFSRRACLDSGVWSGYTPTCTSNSRIVNLSIGETAGFTILIAALGFTIGITLSSIVFCWVRELRRRKKRMECLTTGASNPARAIPGDPETANRVEGPQYESIDEVMIKEKILIRENVAYDLTQ